MALWLDVNPRSGVPIYVQIVEQIRHAVEVGALQPGEQLPTVRQLAAELTIAPNTIVKAYNELQAMKLIESRPGVGSVVAAGAENIEHARQRQTEALYSRLAAVVRDASALGLDPRDLLTRLEEALEQYYGVKEGEQDGNRG